MFVYWRSCGCQPTYTPCCTTPNRPPENQQICREAESAMNYYQLSDTVRNTVLKVLGHMSAPESVACSCTCFLCTMYGVCVKRPLASMHPESHPPQPHNPPPQPATSREDGLRRRRQDDCGADRVGHHRPPDRQVPPLHARARAHGHPRDGALHLGTRCFWLFCWVVLVDSWVCWVGRLSHEHIKTQCAAN